MSGITSLVVDDPLKAALGSAKHALITFSIIHHRLCVHICNVIVQSISMAGHHLGEKNPWPLHAFLISNLVLDISAAGINIPRSRCLPAHLGSRCGTCNRGFCINPATVAHCLHSQQKYTFSRLKTPLLTSGSSIQRLFSATFISQ